MLSFRRIVNVVNVVKMWWQSKLNSIDWVPSAPAVKHIDPNHNRIHADYEVVASIEKVEVSVLHVVVALGIADKLPDRLCLAAQHVVSRNRSG